MNRSRIEAERKPREAEIFRQNSHACQKVPDRKSRLEMRKHNEDMTQTTIEAERKPRQAENFRKKGHSHGCPEM
jgi:hypothetical protein